MASTINVEIANAWTPVCPTGYTFVTVSAHSASASAEWIISDAATPSEDLTGHPMPRDEFIATAILNGEQLFVRKAGDAPMMAAVTVGSRTH